MSHAKSQSIAKFLRPSAPSACNKNMSLCSSVKKTLCPSVYFRVPIISAPFAPLRERIFHTEDTESLRCVIASRRRRRLSQTMLFILTQRRKVSQSFCARLRRLRATKICSYVLLSKKLCVLPCIPCANKSPRPFASLRERCSV